MEKVVRSVAVIKLLLILGFYVLCSDVTAQEIEVSDFTKDFDTSKYDILWPTPSDYAIVFIFSNKRISVNANLGVLKEERDESGVHILFLPKGTSNIVISYLDYHSLNYEIPEPLKAKTVYKMEVNVSKKKKVQDKVKDDKKKNTRDKAKDNNSNFPSSPAKSSDIQISSFVHNLKSLIASFIPEYDKQGIACAVIRYTVNDENFDIEPNLGSIKTIRKSGEILQYVPMGTKRITIRNGNYMPLRDYEIPMEIESKATYDVVLSLTDQAIRRQKASPDHDNYLGIGYNNPNLSFNNIGGTRRFTIHCNTSWDISAPSWCKLSKDAGTGVMEIEVTAKNNSTGKSRHGVIGIQSQDITVTIVVEQEGK